MGLFFLGFSQSKVAPNNQIGGINGWNLVEPMNVGTNLWNANQNRDWTDWQQLEFNNKTSSLPPWRTEFSFFLLDQHRLDNPQQPKRWGLIEPQDTLW